MRDDPVELMKALNNLEMAVREMALKATEHEKLKASVQVLFNHIKMLPEDKAEEVPKP